MGLYDTAQTHQTCSLKLDSRFYRTFGKTYIQLSYFQKLCLKFTEKFLCGVDIQQITREDVLSQKNVLVLKRWGWKFNTSALAKMMLPCIQNWTLAYTVLVKCLGQFRNDNFIDLQHGRKYKTEEELSSFPQIWVFASTATAHSIYIVWMKHIHQLVQNPTALRMSNIIPYLSLRQFTEHGLSQCR